MNKGKKIIIGILSFFLVVAIGVAGVYYYYLSNLKPIDDKNEEVQFTIQPGEYSETILTRLEENKIIKNAFMARVYVKLSKMSDFKAGDFIINKSWGTKKIVEYLNSSEAAKAAQVSVTIIEGAWAKDIAETMSENTNVTSEELLRLWNDRDYINELASDYWFITPEIYNSQKVILEGYLFPDTYYFLKNTTADAITRRFLDQTELVLDEFKDSIEKSKFNVHELMTLASVIQYEGKQLKDMKLISSVFYNRLEIGMKLQSSVTVCYALYDKLKTWKDCETNPNLPSDYNTYLVDGLPPGPILNFGKNALEAACNPTKSSYYYFMAEVYGSGKIHFAKTYEQHLRNCAKYLG